MSDGSHPCTTDGCKNVVPYDDEPKCYDHSPDSGSNVVGYSYRESHRNASLDLVCDKALDWAEEYGFSQSDEARKVLLAIYAVNPDALGGANRAWAEAQVNK